MSQEYLQSEKKKLSKINQLELQRVEDLATLLAYFQSFSSFLSLNLIKAKSIYANFGIPFKIPKSDFDECWFQNSNYLIQIINN